MYRDNTLVPAEATRLLALGLLMEAPLSYAALAQSVRSFTSQIVGPSLDLIGTPLEVLKIEGLVTVDGDGDSDDDEAPLRVTQEGQKEFAELMASNLRAPVTDMSQLIIAIKMRLLHLAEPKIQALQVNLLADIYERQLARLLELKAGHATGKDSAFNTWLEREIQHSQDLLTHYEDLAAEMDGAT